MPCGCRQSVPTQEMSPEEAAAHQERLKEIRETQERIRLERNEERRRIREERLYGRLKGR